MGLAEILKLFSYCFMSFSPAHIALKILKGSCLHNLLVHTTHTYLCGWICMEERESFEIKNF